MRRAGRDAITPRKLRETRTRQRDKQLLHGPPILCHNMPYLGNMPILSPQNVLDPGLCRWPPDTVNNVCMNNTVHKCLGGWII
jgi:hypothetical protein